MHVGGQIKISEMLVFISTTVKFLGIKNDFVSLCALWNPYLDTYALDWKEFLPMFTEGRNSV